MRKSKIKQITLAVCLSLMPLAAFSAGLGKLNVTSGLGEPLKAEIELLSVSPEELSTLVAAIASEEAYNAQGISRLAIHNNIKVEVSKSSAGSPIIKIRSSQPVNDPYLDMLIQVDWASGRLQREYTVLLDPPGYKPAMEASMPLQIAAPVVNAPAVKLPGSVVTSQPSEPALSITATDEVKTAPIEEIKPVQKAKKTQATAAIAETSESTIETLTTKRGDTLNAIARQLQVEGVSLDQMLIGLYANNKSAFSGGNMNRLKVGQIIKLPPKEVLTSTSEKQASKSVRAQSANWNEYRNSLAGAVATLPETEEVEQKQSASGKIVTTEDKAIKPKSGPQDVVKLSAGEKDKSKAGKDGNKEFEAKIVALQEETTAREKSLKEAQERTSALEKQIQDMQKLLALKSQNMAEVQKNADEAVKSGADAKNVEPTSPAAEVKSEAPSVTTPSVPKAEVQPVDNSVSAEAKPTINKPKVATPPTPVIAEESEPSLLDTLKGFVDTTILAAIAILGLLAAGWMFLRNKRRKDLDSFERGILTSGGLRANTVFGNTTGATSNTDTSFLTDFAQSADGSMIDTNDVDPIAEAEVYMAYGRDAQAEEILKDAITKEPKRYELHLKLLEMYASRKDTSAFEAIAGELYTTLGSDDPTWAKVAIIGAAMEPENPLYDISKISTSESSQLETQKLDASDFDNVDVQNDLDLDFSLGSDEPEDTANSAVAQSFAGADFVEQEVSFDMGSLDIAADEPALDGANSNISAENAMDFDLGDFGSVTESTIIMSSSASNAPSVDLNAIDTMDNLPQFDMPVEAKNDFNMDFELPNNLEAVAFESKTVTEDMAFDLDSRLEETAKQSDESLAAADFSSSDFSFDLPSADETKLDEVKIDPSDSALQEVNTPANEFDLSTISLDLNDAATQEDEVSIEALDSVNTAFPMASEDVDIKLDLVAAYIDMDDKEGARELLEEIINEGGAQQKVRAKQLLDSLN